MFNNDSVFENDSLLDKSKDCELGLEQNGEITELKIPQNNPNFLNFLVSFVYNYLT